jgi:hypothetical protein
MSDIFQDWQVQRDPSHYDTLSTVTNGKVRIEIGGDITPEEQAQIAHMIKAAPYMFDSLKRLVEWHCDFADYVQDEGVWTMNPECEIPIINARGAMRTAEGRQE